MASKPFTHRGRRPSSYTEPRDLERMRQQIREDESTVQAPDHANIQLIDPNETNSHENRDQECHFRNQNERIIDAIERPDEQSKKYRVRKTGGHVIVHNKFHGVQNRTRRQKKQIEDHKLKKVFFVRLERCPKADILALNRAPAKIKLRRSTVATARPAQFEQPYQYDGDSHSDDHLNFSEESDNDSNKENVAPIAVNAMLPTSRAPLQPMHGQKLINSNGRKVTFADLPRSPISNVMQINGQSPSVSSDMDITIVEELRPHVLSAMQNDDQLLPAPSCSRIADDEKKSPRAPVPDAIGNDGPTLSISAGPSASIVGASSHAPISKEKQKAGQKQSPEWNISNIDSMLSGFKTDGLPKKCPLLKRLGKDTNEFINFHLQYLAETLAGNYVDTGNESSSGSDYSEYLSDGADDAQQM